MASTTKTRNGCHLPNKHPLFAHPVWARRWTSSRSCSLFSSSSGSPCWDYLNSRFTFPWYTQNSLPWYVFSCGLTSPLASPSYIDHNSVVGVDTAHHLENTHYCPLIVKPCLCNIHKSFKKLGGISWECHFKRVR